MLQLRLRHRRILGKPDLHRSLIIFADRRPWKPFGLSLSIRELYLQDAILRSLNHIWKSLSCGKQRNPKRGAGIINDDVGNLVRAVVDHIDLDHPRVRATSQQKQSEKHDTGFRHYFFSIARALSTTPLRLSWSLSGKTRMFQFQRSDLVGR